MKAISASLAWRTRARMDSIEVWVAARKSVWLKPAAKSTNLTARLRTGEKSICMTLLSQALGLKSRYTWFTNHTWYIHLDGP